MTEREWLESVDPKTMLDFLSGRPEATYSGPGGLKPKRRVSVRQLRLFACACCRSVWHLLTDSHSRSAVEVAERLADGLATGPEARDARRSLHQFIGSDSGPGTWGDYLACCACDENAADAARAAVAEPRYTWKKAMSDAAQAALLREIVGNPFRPVTLPWRCGRCGIVCGPPTLGYFCVKCAAPKDKTVCPWLTPAVLSVARAAYDLREWDRLPVLADALEDAGCPAEEVCGECPEWVGVATRGGYLDDAVQAVIDWGKAKKACRCKGTGRVPNPILEHLRGPGPHVRGCWCLDLLLGKEDQKLTTIGRLDG